MDFTQFAATPSPIRHDGWTDELKVRFLDHLSLKGNVRAACRLTGMSAQAVYRLKRRDPLFARGWAAALVLARDACEQVLADRAIDGIEEDVWHRGELVGTRRRYDTRLLLAHLGRLDVRSIGLGARGDAERFDQLLALIAGEKVPEGFAKRGELLPSDREEVAARASDAALDALADAQENGGDGDGDGDEDGKGLTEEEWFALGEAESKRARKDAEQRWDAWFARACEVVDRAAACPDVPPAPDLSGSPLPAARDAPGAGETGEAGNGGAAFSSPCTVSLVSTSSLARALAAPRPLPAQTPRSPFAGTG